MIFNMGGLNPLSVMPVMSFDGSWSGLIDDGVVDGVQNWRAKFYSSGTLTISKLGNASKGIDVFCVGGGGGGSYATGGGGGYTKQATKSVSATSYTITIGSGGSGYSSGGNVDQSQNNEDTTDGGATKAFGVTANGGKHGTYAYYGGNGGSGGAGMGSGLSGGTNGGNGGGGPDSNGSGVNRPGTGQGSTTKEFGTGTLYASGGGTAARYAAGTSASANTGNGGQGGGLVSSGGPTKGGKGGSGIVVIRNAR